MVLPSGADPRTERRAPTPEPVVSKRKVKRPWCPVSCLCWLAVPGFFLVSVRWLSCWVPAWFLSVFSFSFCLFPLAAGVTFQLPDGRDVGSNARAPTQETVQGADPRTGFYRYPSAYGFVVYLVAPDLFFPLHFAILLWRS